MKLSKKSDIKLTVNGRVLSQALARILSVTDYVDCLETERKHLIAVNSKGCFVVGITPTAFACVRIEAEDVSVGTVAIDSKLLTGLIKNVTEVRIESNGSDLVVKGLKSRYKAVVPVLEIEDGTYVQFENDSSVDSKKRLSPEVVKALREGVKLSAVTDIYAEGSDVLTVIRLKKKGVIITCNDNFHASMYKCALKSPPAFTFNMAIPTRAFMLIDKFIEDTEVAFNVNDSSISVSNDDFIVSLPEEQASDHAYNQVPDYIKSLTNPKLEFDLESDQLTPVKNMMTISDKDTRMSIAVNSKALKLGLTTKSGSVSDSYPLDNVKGKASAHTDPRVFTDLLNKIDGRTVHFSFFEAESGVASCVTLLSKSDNSTLHQVCAVYGDSN